jgi:hypothetical protein
MMFDPSQEIAFMQAMSGYGMQQPMAGTAGLMQNINALGGLPGSSINLNPFMANASPLGGLGLEQFGFFGNVASMFGNYYLNNRFQSQGVLPMGNAGSYMQALQARDLINQQQALTRNVAPLDQQSMFNTFKGVAATLGVPFGEQQQNAARQMASTITQIAPVLNMQAPGIMDALTGPAGSVQALASQMMQANRYQVDPYSGKMGYSTEANTALVNSVYNDLYSQDNIVRMQGIKAGELGEFYRNMAPEGLVKPAGGLRQRTLNTLLEMRREGIDLQGIGQQAGLANPAALDQNLSELTNTELSKLRQNTGVGARLTQADSTQIKQQLQGYVDSLGAMRELFGEQGDSNAPMAKLITGLKAFSGGNIQKFEANQLNSIVRDVQAMTQLSGKSVDQLFRMQQEAIMMGNAVPGLQGNMVNFAPTAVSVGVNTGMAFNKLGPVTGFGALSREQAEQAATRIFSRTLGSETTNMIGALSRINEAGGLGPELKAILDAASTAGATTYEFNGVERAIPTNQNALIDIVSRDGIPNMNANTFRGFLRDRTANLRALADNPEAQQAAMRLAPMEFQRSVALEFRGRLLNEESLEGLDATSRGRAATAISNAAINALMDLDPSRVNDEQYRNEVVAAAVLEAGQKSNLNLDEKTAKNIAASAFAKAEARSSSIGFDSFTGALQVIGNPVVEVRNASQMQTKIQSKLNQALAGFGDKTSGFNKIGNAFMQAGVRGESADLQTLLMDLLGSNVDVEAKNLQGPMQEIGDLYKTITQATADIEGASPKEILNIGKDTLPVIEKMNKLILDARTESIKYGLVDQASVFNVQDVTRAKEAFGSIDKNTELKQQLLANDSKEITQADLNKLATSDLTDSDFAVLAGATVASKKEDIKNLSVSQLQDIKGYDEFAKAVAGRGTEQEIASGFRSKLLKELDLAVSSGAATEAEKQAYSKLGKTTVGQLTGSQQIDIARSRIGTYTPEKREEILSAIKDQFSILDTTLTEFQSDPNALLRGGAFAGQNLDEATRAQQSLTGIAATYFGSDRGKMYLGELDATAQDQLAKDKNFTGSLEERKKELNKQIQSNFATLKSSVLSLSGAANINYSSILTPTYEATAYGGKSPEGVQALLTAAQLGGIDLTEIGLEKAQVNKLAGQLMAGKPIELKNKDQQRVVDIASGLVGLKELDPKRMEDVAKSARLLDKTAGSYANALGVDEEAIRNYMQGGSAAVPALKVKDRSTLASLRTAAATANNLDLNQTQRDKSIAELQSYGLTPANAASFIAEQQTLLDMNVDKASYLEYSKGISPAIVNTYSLGVAQANKKAANLAKLNLRDTSINNLVKGLGITDSESEEFKSIENRVNLADSTDIRNLKLVGNTLSSISKLEGFDASSSTFERLKTLAKATPEEIQELKKANPALSSETIEDLRKNTNFLELDKMSKDAKPSDYLLQRLQAVSGIDVQAERDKDRESKLSVSGELVVKGDIVGTAALNDVTGLLRV